MRASNKILGAVLALAMTVGTVSGAPVAGDVLGAETVQAATKTKTQAISISNVKNWKATLYTGQSLSFKTNYKENQLKVSTSDKSVVSVKGIKITGVNKGTAKVTVAVKSNTKVKKTITVKVVDRYIIRKSDEGGNAVTEKYDRKTKKSTYTVAMTGTDELNKADISIKFKFTSKDTHMAGTGFAGEMNNVGMNRDISYIKIYNVTKDDSYKQIIDFNKKSDKELYKYYELTKAEIKQTKFTHNNTDAGYVMASVVPHGKNGLVKECLIKDKETGTLYKLEYQGSEDPYAVYKSVKVIK